MNEEMSDLPQAETADPDGVQVALRAAQTLWSRGETSESLKWLRKAAESASDEGADVRSLQLAKGAAEVRAKLFGGGDVARSSAGEISGAHPIAEHLAAHGRAQGGPASSRPDGDAARSSFPPAGYAADPGEASGSVEHAGQSSRPVTATQYPSHRPRQRIGLTSSIPGAAPAPRESVYGARDGAYGTRESAAYAAVPSWSADAERRVSAAPPPLPLSAIDDYEELEAEPDDEPGDDPGSVWSGAGESWRPPEPAATESGLAPSMSSPSASSSSNVAPSSAAPSNVAPSALPPPLPPRGAFSDDDGDFGSLGDPPTVVIPAADEVEAGVGREPRWTESGDVWDRESRLSGWDQDSGGSWAADLRSNGWASLQSGSAEASAETNLAVGFDVSDAATSPPSRSVSVDVASPAAGSSVADATSSEPAPPSDTARAKLTARVHHQAVRVSFAPDLRVPGQYVVRPLREGEKAATGERIALLVALEPGVPLV
jgi:hypothetical protein